MKIEGNIYCLFEQSGTFKTEFQKLGYKAYDYDIKNEYNTTDYCVDLFIEIEKAYNNETSIFDDFSSNDLLIAFFPCIYFSESNMLFFCGVSNVLKKNTDTEKIIKIIERDEQRHIFYKKLWQLVYIAKCNKLRLIIENPFSPVGYLRNNFLKPSFVDKDRTRRGDKFEKPTAFYFINCQPTEGLFSWQPRKAIKINSLSGHVGSGICSKERSEITSDYARNFICDKIIGNPQKNTILGLWTMK